MSAHDTDLALPDLPELSDERLGEIEAGLVRSLEREREHTQKQRRREQERRRTRRRTVWLSVGGAAAALALFAAVSPYLGGLGATSAGGDADAGSGLVLVPGEAVAPDAGFESLPGDAAQSLEEAARPGASDGAGASSETATTDAGREIVATASATVEVDDAAAAARTIGEAADAAGGYVEVMSVGESGVMPATGGDAVVYPTPGGAWITVRVPAAELTGVLAGLADVGEVRASETSRRDVTGEAVDLRARVDALQASVDRLTELLADADTTADLVAAESALAQRQSELASLQSQLALLDEQVAMSSLSVTLDEPRPAVEPDPAGFGDGITSGWNGLLAALNGLVVAVGFLLPWFAVAAVVAGVVLLVRRLARRRRAPRPPTPEP